MKRVRKNGVSIIVLLFNPDIIKLERTIKSIIDQKDIDFEIILTDDGSKENPQSFVNTIFSKYEFTNYRFHRNEKNLGTVKNILSVLELAQHKYIYLISPGDLIYDKTTMRDFVDFADEHNAKVCFGNYICYSADNSRVNIINMVQKPGKTSLYDVANYDFYKSKVYSLLGGNVLGPSLFREKDYAIKFFNLTSKSSIYVEDNTSLAFSFAENIPLFHNNRNICWYEGGSGITTSGNSEWYRKIDLDFNNTYLLLKKDYPKDKVIDAAYIKRFGKYKNNKILSLIFMLIKHPIVFFTRLSQNKIPNVQTSCNPLQKEILEKLLSEIPRK